MGKLPGEKAPVFAALLEIHIHDFKGHVLGSIVAHHCGGFDMAHADLQPELDGRSRYEVTTNACEAAAQAGRLDLEPTVFFEIHAHGPHRFLQPDALMAPLPHKSRPRGNL